MGDQVKLELTDKINKVATITILLYFKLFCSTHDSKLLDQLIFIYILAGFLGETSSIETNVV